MAHRSRPDWWVRAVWRQGPGDNDGMTKALVSTSVGQDSDVPDASNASSHLSAVVMRNRRYVSVWTVAPMLHCTGTLLMLAQFGDRTLRWDEKRSAVLALQMSGRSSGSCREAIAFGHDS